MDNHSTIHIDTDSDTGVQRHECPACPYVALVGGDIGYRCIEVGNPDVRHTGGT